MAVGIRISHPTARSGTFTFQHLKRPYPAPVICLMCRSAHTVKTYHIGVDHNGFAIVSPTVWGMMKKHNTAGFRVANEVAAPPAQLVGFAPVHIDVTPLE